MKIGKASSGTVLKRLVVAVFALLPAVEAPAEPTSQPATMPEYSYQGKPISLAQFNALYREFGQKTLLLDGKLLDLGEAIARDSTGARFTRPVWAEVPAIGSVRAGQGEITHVDKDGVLVYQAGSPTQFDPVGGQPVVPGSPAVTFRVRGIDGTKFAEGATVAFTHLIFVGTVQVGAHNVQEFITTASPPTRDQFAEGLKSGITLYRYTKSSKDPVIIKPQPDPPVKAEGKPLEKPEAPVQDSGEQRLSLAETYRAGGLTAKAKEILESVIKDFPDTPAAAKAKQALEGLRP